MVAAHGSLLLHYAQRRKAGTSQFAFLADHTAMRLQGIGITTDELMPCPKSTYTGDCSAPGFWPPP